MVADATLTLMSLIDSVLEKACNPMPMRAIFFRRLLSRFPIRSFSTRLRAGAFQRPWYAWSLYAAALEAKSLGYQATTVLELGVAGGNGLVTLCDYRDEIVKELGVQIHIVGLDAGTGLPESSDPRDLLYVWPSGSFEMDVPKLKRRLNGRADVILGDVAVTAKQVSFPPDAPLGAIMFDLDMYTSTRDAFALFLHDNLLPRVWCYFDDIVGDESHAYSDEIGVRAAIKEFNAAWNPMERHLSQAYVFKNQFPEEWHQRIYVYHNMKHRHYNTCMSDHKHTLELV